MKIASWNVNSLNVRLDHVQDWVDREQPDYLCLQETKLPDESFPIEALGELGYDVVFSGQKTYNGVAIMSRQTGTDIVTDIPGLEDPQRRILAATYGDVRLIDLYVVNGQSVGSDKFRHKLHWLERVTEWVGEELGRHDQLVVVGDFNIAPDDRDVHDPAKWHEKIHCSTPEREALGRLLDLGLSDTFRLHHEEGGIYSWWDYRMGAYRRKMGLRIDLILASDAMAERCTASYVDEAPRKLERPSDHAPVVAEFR